MKYRQNEQCYHITWLYFIVFGKVLGHFVPVKNEIINMLSPDNMKRYYLLFDSLELLLAIIPLVSSVHLFKYN